MRDPVHAYVHVEYQIIWDLINAPEFQRLRRIHQLGATYQVYHGAEHSRFSHSLGVYELVRQMIQKISGFQDVLSEFEQIALLCAGLLHDVGHGPYSHAFESVTQVDHETFTDRIILEDSGIHRILKRADAHLPQVVADIIAHRHARKLLTQVISSEMDADRMDYLLRDSYYTGVSYGEFDLQRILRTLKVVDDQIVVKESGIHAIEDYIMARYQMYWQVYLHPTSRSFEVILHSLFERMRDVKDTDLLDAVPIFKPFLSGKDISLEDHYRLDEASTLAGFMLLQHSKDPILSDLSRRLLNRDLFQFQTIDQGFDSAPIIESVKQAGLDPKYYVKTDFMKEVLYLPYVDHGGIFVSTKEGISEITQVSQIVRGFASTEDKEDRKIYYPRSLGGHDE